MEDTKIIYHIDDENTPYLVKISKNADKVTLGDFKAALNRPNYKFFFKSVDADFGVVKEEITEDTASLPCFSGKVIAWLVTADGSAKSDNHSSLSDGQRYHGKANFGSKSSDQHDEADGTTPINKRIGQEHHEDFETYRDNESVCSGDHLPPLRNFQNYKFASRLTKHGRGNQSIYDTSSSMLSSDMESTSFCDSEDESSRFSTATGTTMSSNRYGTHRQRRRRRLLPINRINEDASSFSSMTDSTMSLNTVTVTLRMDTVNFLGISIVGQSNRAGDGGIYVGSIMRGGAVALDGRIEPGDMLLEVNGISFEDMSNDDAVRVLREQVQKPGPITLVVAKCWDPNPPNSRGYNFTLSRQEPVRPIDPRAWVLHTNAMTGAAGPGNADGHPSSAVGGGAPMPSVGAAFCGSFPQGVSSAGLIQQPTTAAKSNTSASSATAKSQPDSTTTAAAAAANPLVGAQSQVSSGAPLSSQQQQTFGGGETAMQQLLPEQLQLNVATEMAIVVRAMLQQDSGLEVQDRTWLKITIPNAVIGSDLVDWLHTHVEGFADRREARQYATNMLKIGYIQHTVNKTTFSEQCYYVFSDLCGAVLLNLENLDSVSEIGAAAHHHHHHHHPVGGMAARPSNCTSVSVSQVTTGGGAGVPSAFPPSATHFSGISGASISSFWCQPVQGQPPGVFAPQMYPPTGQQKQPSQLLTALPTGLSPTEPKSMAPLQSISNTSKEPQHTAADDDDDGTSSPSASENSSPSSSSGSSTCSSTMQNPRRVKAAVTVATNLNSVSPQPAASRLFNNHPAAAAASVASGSVYDTVPCSCLPLRRRHQREAIDYSAGQQSTARNNRSLEQLSTTATTATPNTDATTTTTGASKDDEAVSGGRGSCRLHEIEETSSIIIGASTASGGGLGIVFPSSPAVAPRPGAGVSVELSASPLLTHSASKTKLSPPQATAGSQPISVGGAAGALFRSPHTAQLPLSTAVVSDAHSTSISQQSSITYCQ